MKILIDEAIDIAGLQNGNCVLDIGCGDGEETQYLADQYGFKVTGIDISETAIAKGKRAHPGLDLRVARSEQTGMPNESFDAVLMNCVCSVLRLHEEALNEASRVLKKGGRLILTDLYIKTEGPYSKEWVLENLKNVGFEEREFFEKSKALGGFVAELILKYGSIDKYLKSIIPEDVTEDHVINKAMKDKSLGYYLLIAKKG